MPTEYGIKLTLIIAGYIVWTLYNVLHNLIAYIIHITVKLHTWNIKYQHSFPITTVIKSDQNQQCNTHQMNE